ncbi:cadherin-like beta sandwich domain-containing protein [Brucepastera parasyntrophica]|uniref:cadherin-like beta sandwich domain-containing protein n=1 Tax=Brucepastera parasyntrophica TaxID=2880008 RepID=UPI00210BC744|nr:cadherin-like beta sandwich domain-containing protein [Brucepastera parasyntrophica]ULQ60845.1 cadherin-like beta sandwich domain-containing protein [Brucepastera parasyntrophica]
MKRKAIGLICILALVAGGLFTACENPFIIALLRKTWTVTYHVNGGSGTAPKKLEVEDGERITAAQGTGLSRPGFTFMGWNTRADGNGALYAAGSKIKVSGDLKLFARWASSGKTITAGDISLAGGSVVVDEESKTITITAPYGTDETDLALDISVDGAVVSPGPGEGQDFTDPVTYTVTAEDGSSEDYTVTVIVAPPSGNADLSGITLSAGTLTPAFDETTVSYTVSVGNSVTSITATGVKADATATVGGDSGTAKPLSVGPNTITITVTAQDGTIQDYTVTVTRAKSSNAVLSGITVSEGTLGPAFAANTTSYTVSVANSVTGITVTGIKADTTATLSANNGVEQTLAVGANTITIRVTAEDGTIKDYTVTVTRAPSSNATLSGVTVSEGTLVPAFDANTISYTVSVGNSVAGITVTGTKADSTATVGGDSGTAKTLAVGANTITITVTAEDGTTKDYTVTVTRSGQRGLGITFTGNAAESINLTGEPASAISRTAADAADREIKLTVTGSYSGYRWFADGTELTGETGAGLTLDAADLSAGVHRILVIVRTEGGAVYSKEAVFTVSE